MLCFLLSDALICSVEIDYNFVSTGTASFIHSDALTVLKHSLVVAFIEDSFRVMPPDSLAFFYEGRLIFEKGPEGRRLPRSRPQRFETYHLL